MKNLLIVTLFFSVTAFTEKNIVRLVCDASYIFYPDYKQREMGIIDLDKGKGSWATFSTIFEPFNFIDGVSFVISEDTISSLGARINRYTLELSYPNRSKKEPIRQCILVDRRELLKEQKKAKDWVKSKLEKRKI